MNITPCARPGGRWCVLAGRLPVWAWTMMMGVALAMTSHAADRDWADVATDFNDAGSWVGSLPPDTANAATFPADADIQNQPNVTADIEVQRVDFKASANGYVLSADPGARLILTTTDSGNNAALIGRHSSGHTNTITAPIVLGAAGGSTQYFRMTATSPQTPLFVLSGGISEANSGVALNVTSGSPSSRWRLSGHSTFTGGLTLGSNGILELGSDAAIPSSGPIAFTGDTSLNVTLRSADDTVRTISRPVDMALGVRLGGNAVGQQGPLVFTGQVTLTDDFTTTVMSVNSPRLLSAAAFESAIGESGGSRSLTVSGGGSAGEGWGYLFLLGPNTYSGRTTLNTSRQIGPVVINTIGNTGETASSLGAPSGADREIDIAIANTSGATATLRYIGGATTTDRELSFGHSAASANAANAILDASGFGPIAWTASAMTVNGVDGSSGARNFYLDGTSGHDNLFAADIPDPPEGTGLLNLTKSGTGQWVLKGASTFTGGLRVNSGRLVLDYADNATVVDNANAITLGGSTLAFRGKSSGATAQTLGNVTATDATGLSTIRVDQNGGDGVALTLGTIAVNPSTYFGPSSVLFDLYGSADSSVTIGTAINPTPGASTVNGYLVIRTPAGQHDFAHNDNSTANPLAAVNSATTIGATTGNGATDYVFTNTATIGNGGTGTAISTRSLRIAPTLNYQTLTIANVNATPPGSSTGLRVAGRGLLFDGGTNDFTIAAAATGFAPICDNNSGGNETAIHHYGSGTLTISSNVYLGRSGTDGFAILGTGLVDHHGRVLGDQSSLRAVFLIHGAVLRISGTTDTILFDATATGAGCAPIILNGGGVFELGNGTDLTRNVGTAAGSVRWRGDGGFSAFGGDHAVNLAGGGTLTWGSGSFVPANNALVLSSAYADSTVDFQNAIALGFQQRVVRVHDGSATVDARLSGALAGSYGGGLIKEGDGTLELTADNAYLGDTWVRGGALWVNNTDGLGTGSGLVTIFADGAISGMGTVNRLTLAGGTLLARAIDGELGTLHIAGALDITNGTLAIADGETLGTGEQVVATFASLEGVEFADVTGLPANRSIAYTPTEIILKGPPAGTVILMR